MKALAVIVSIMSLAAIPPPQRSTEIRETSSTGRLKISSRDVSRNRSTGFDRVAALVPDAAPELWQRGIALYYVGRYDDCRKQFESHRTVNPNDVENPGLALSGVAHAESPAKAQAALLPVGPDQRSPMREVYEMFKGTMTPEAVLAAAGQSTSARFFAELYVGLYYEANGNKTAGLTHLKAAASEQYANAGGYMHRVATLHPLLVGGRQ